MFTVRKHIEIDAGHRVPFHASQCRHLHGHRWKIVAEVSAPELVAADPSRPDSGMVMDYGVIKQILMEHIHKVFDHRFILWDQDPLLAVVLPPPQRSSLLTVLSEVHILSSIVTVPVIPTSEGLAKFWYGIIEPYLKGEWLNLTAVEVWETPTSVAAYRPEDLQ